MEFRRTGRRPIPPTPPLLGPKPKLEDLRTPSGFAAWGSFLRRSLDDEARRIAANIAKLPTCCGDKHPSDPTRWNAAATIADPGWSS